jgi:hypothetical protein
MAICNRDNGLSQQRESRSFISNAAVATGVTLVVATIPYACTLEGIWGGILGLSGAPAYAFNVLRFTAGGATVMALGVSTFIPGAALGVSKGLEGWSGIRAAGSSLLLLQAGDVVCVTSSVANTSAEKLIVDLIVKKTADLVSHYGLAT